MSGVNRPGLRLLDRPRAVVRVPSDPRPDARQWHPAQNRRRRTVLYVTGDADNRQLFARALGRRETVKLLVATGGHAGLEAAVDRQPVVVVVEARMSDMSGEVFVGALRRQLTSAATPIVVVADDGTPTERARFVWAGATAYLIPPLDEDEIVRAVGTLLEVAAWR
jgi:DNA-binding response OmpR family regulator